jgi:hypothetical protein
MRGLMMEGKITGSLEFFQPGKDNGFLFESVGLNLA